MEYHALITGLPTIHAQDERPLVSLQCFKADMMPLLSAHDRELVGLYLLRYDNKNLLAHLENWDDRGIYSQEELTEAIEQARSIDTSNRKLPAYIYSFIEKESTLPADRLAEDLLAELYFDYALKANNEMVREWFAFERDTNNLLTMLTGKKHGFDARRSLIGSDETTEAMRTSQLADWGLSSSLPYWSEVNRIVAISDPVEKERQLDIMRWRYLADKTFFHYFTVEKVFAYVIQCDIIERWSRLEAETGQQVFRKMIADISSKAELPSDFR